jgi:uncharacterized protein (TIGR02246 family)
MKRASLFILIYLLSSTSIFAQNTGINKNWEQQIYSLIEKYTLSRETMDTVLLKSILTPDIDQLVSSGEWRNGIEGAMKGMVRSSTSNPGDRTIKIDKIRLLNPECAIVDAKYEIQNTDGTVRKMWSTFVVVYKEDMWKITAIRNMLPAG